MYSLHNLDWIDLIQGNYEGTMCDFLRQVMPPQLFRGILSTCIKAKGHNVTETFVNICENIRINILRSEWHDLFCLAVEYDKIDIVKYLVEKKGVEVRGERDVATEICLRKNNVKILKYLISKGAKVRENNISKVFK